MRSLASEILAEIGPRLGVQVNLEPTYGYVGQLIAPDGRKLYFRNTSFDLNGQGASEIARDKGHAAHFMLRMGYPVPEGETFYSDAWCRVIGSDRTIHAAYACARQLGFPVVVKPNSKSHGSGVAKVYTKRQFYTAMRAVFRISDDRVALVQRFIPGDDYRVVVLDDAAVLAYQRTPLSVIGDGRANIDELLRTKLGCLASAGREVSISVEDRRVERRLHRAGLSRQSVPALAERVALLDNANLSTGGDAVDVTDSIHDGYRFLAVQLARDMGLRYCGIDFLIRRSIDQPPADFVVLEINAAPAVDHYARTGEQPRKRVEAMYERVLRLLIGV